MDANDKESAPHLKASITGQPVTADEPGTPAPDAAIEVDAPSGIRAADVSAADTGPVTSVADAGFVPEQVIAPAADPVQGAAPRAATEEDHVLDLTAFHSPIVDPDRQEQLALSASVAGPQSGLSGTAGPSPDRSESPVEADASETDDSRGALGALANDNGSGNGPTGGDIPLLDLTLADEPAPTSDGEPRAVPGVSGTRELAVETDAISQADALANDVERPDVELPTSNVPTSTIPKT